MKRIIAAAALTLFTAGIAMAADTIDLSGQERRRDLPPQDAPGSTEGLQGMPRKAGGKIEGFGKDWAHKTCKGCHQEKAKGPTKCGDCHKK